MQYVSGGAGYILSRVAALKLSQQSTLHSMVPDTTLTARGAMTMSMTLSDSSDLITITLTGPDIVYFSIAMGSCTMKDSWALVIPGGGEAPFEQKLGADKPGDRLLSTFQIESDVTSNNLRTVIFTRSLSMNILDDSYFPFSTELDTVNVMWAYGKGPEFGNHGGSQRGCLLISYLKTEEEAYDTEREEAVTIGIGRQLLPMN